MQRYIGFISYYPAVVRFGGNMKYGSWTELKNLAAFHRRRCFPGYDQPYVLNLTELCSRDRSDMFRPFPARFVGRSAERHSADPYYLKLALLKNSSLIRVVKAFHHNFDHKITPI